MVFRLSNPIISLYLVTLPSLSGTSSWLQRSPGLHEPRLHHNRDPGDSGDAAGPKYCQVKGADGIKMTSSNVCP